MAILLGGALTAVLAICAVAGLFILRSAGDPPEERIEPARSQQSAASQPRTTFTPFDVVPSSCDLVKGETASRLVPQSTARLHEGTETDEYSKCSWGDLEASDPRELALEVRGISGDAPIKQATTMFQEEAEADKGGEGLLSGQKLKRVQEVKGVGDRAYELFIVDRFQGQGIVNVQVGNVLITVSYGGSVKDDTPLGEGTCLEGAREVAKVAAEAVRAAAA
ncbi:hypothetical protein [Actinocorallia aurantiaca]|uniref:DUF3558 domain-containing protein n=1 Tax=Actinocorallia aurantiaca TaxID=46204 RepID=A0ABP6GKI4_9ACTN